nr:MAG TPA: hypothetical protein [Caudoviricetes sp.]
MLMLVSRSMFANAAHNEYVIYYVQIAYGLRKAK